MDLRKHSKTPWKTPTKELETEDETPWERHGKGSHWSKTPIEGESHASTERLVLLSSSPLGHLSVSQHGWRISSPPSLFTAKWSTAEPTVIVLFFGALFITVILSHDQAKTIRGNVALVNWDHIICYFFLSLKPLLVC